MKYGFLISSFWILFICEANIQVGSDLFFQTSYLQELKGKTVGLVTNSTAVDSSLRSTIQLLEEAATDFTFSTIFSPEHGLFGSEYAGKSVSNIKKGKIRCYSLYGDHRRPTSQMLQNLDSIIYDIQEIGCRSYTYATTLYYLMEECAKKGIEVIVLDRPNPIGGLIVDGPMLEDEYRSFVGYINVPYCHGMTIGELALFFNEEYKIQCKLKIIPLYGWKREMAFDETGLQWIPTSPNVPESSTPLYYPITGIIGELGIVNIGIGYTLPFKIIGAPWIEGAELALVLNQQKLSGVYFLPFSFQPYFGIYKGEKCQGVQILVTNSKIFKPVTTGYIILSVLKTLYPQQILKRLETISPNQKQMFLKINGNKQAWDCLLQEKYPGWPLASIHSEERSNFLKKREKYLLYP